METRSRRRPPSRGGVSGSAVADQTATDAQTRRTTRRSSALQPAAQDHQPEEEVVTTMAEATVPLYPHARRGARPAHYARSVASIATHPPKADDESDYDDYEEEEAEEDEQEEEGEESGDDEASSGLQDKIQSGSGASDEELALEEARRQAMLLSIRDLATAAKGLMNCLQTPDHENPVLREFIQMKRDIFFSVRQSYISPPALLCERDWLYNLQHPLASDVIETATAALALANIVTSLEFIERAKSGEDLDPLPLLDELDRAFPQLFTIPGNSDKYAHLALEIRTIRWIETLAVTKPTEDPRKITALIFTEPGAAAEKAYGDLFIQGPFKSLGGFRDGDDSLTQICSKRIGKLFPFIMAGKKCKRPLPISELRDAYPLKKMLGSLREWLLSIYSTLASRLKHVEPALRSLPAYADVFGEISGDVSSYASDGVSGGVQADAAESVVESQADSPPIVRARDTGISLFQGVNSLRHLNQAPSSNQPRHVSFPPGTFKTFPSPPRADASRQPPIMLGDDDGEFDTDTRPLDMGKRKAMAEAMETSKRHRAAAGLEPVSSSRTDMPPPALPNRVPSSSGFMPLPPLPQYRQPPPASSAPVPFQRPPLPPPPPPPSSAPPLQEQQRPSSPSSYHPDFPARQPPFPAYKQRHAWSDHDSRVLLDLIYRHQASWSSIWNHDAGLFERPRSQGAYRDRARNMKVDYLITDQLLPPGFNKVNLHGKEIERVRKAGKNPRRREEDVDENGRPTRTDARYEGDTV